MLTPHDVHHGRARRVFEQRQSTLRLDWDRHPERYVHGTPKPQPLPLEVRINPPGVSGTARPAQHIVTAAVSMSLTGIVPQEWRSPILLVSAPTTARDPTRGLDDENDSDVGRRHASTLSAEQGAAPSEHDNYHPTGRASMGGPRSKGRETSPKMGSAWVTSRRKTRKGEEHSSAV